MYKNLQFAPQSSILHLLRHRRLHTAAVQALSLVASEVEHYCIGYFHGLIFYQHNIISVQVGLLPLLHLDARQKPN